MRRVLEWCLRILLKWLQCLYELLCVGPVILFLAVAMTPGEYLWVWPAYLAGACLLGLLLGLPLKKSRVWLRLLLALAVAIVPACWLFPPENWAPIATFLGIIAVYRGSKLTYAPWEEHYPLPVSWIGLGLYFVLSYLFLKGQLLLPYLPWLSAMGMAFIVATVFALNHRAMEKAAPSLEGRIPLPRRMIKQNHWLITLFIIIVLAAGLFRQIKEAVTTGAIAVAQWIMGLLNAIYGRMERVPLEQGTMPILPEAGTANPFWQKVLTILLYIVAGAVALFLLAGFFAAIWAGLRRLYRGLISLLGRRGEPLSQAYIDKRESLWDMGRMARHTMVRARKWLHTRFAPRERWADMADNRQRARFLYRRCIRRAMEAGFHPDLAATAAETLAAARAYDGEGAPPAALASVYEMARYGQEQPSDTEIAAIKAALDQ